MTEHILSQKLNQQYEALREILESFVVLTKKCLENEKAKILSERLARLKSAALFVVVGEVNSGKSSFINALLGEYICEVDPAPCTAEIQELVYGDDHTKTPLGDHWERVYLSKAVLKEISIVDTPGTNSIIEKHQAITEQYIPQSDLVVFVFPAKNPHTGTAWDLLKLIKSEWHRKVVFVLQQSDTARPDELSTNIESVKRYARERNNIQDPKVFAVSATREIEGTQDSGYGKFREFLRLAVESGEVWKMKVDSINETVEKIISELFTRLCDEEKTIAGDKVFYQKLQSEVHRRHAKANLLRKHVVDSLCNKYDLLCLQLESDFKEGLGVGNILRRSVPIIGGKNFKKWLEDLHDEFKEAAKRDIKEVSEDVSKDLSNEMEDMLRSLDKDIANRQERQGEKPLLLFAADRTEILDALRGQLRGLRGIDTVIDEGFALGELTLTGSGIVALGAIIALATQIIALDITGGILATMGVSLVAVTLLWKRTGLTKEFSKKLAESRNDFRNRLEQEITEMFDRLYFEIDQMLEEAVVRLDDKATLIAPYIEEASDIKKSLKGIVLT